MSSFVTQLLIGLLYKENTMTSIKKKKKLHINLSNIYIHLNFYFPVQSF